MTEAEYADLNASARKVYLERIGEYQKRVVKGKFGTLENTSYVVLLNPQWAMRIYLDRLWKYQLIPFDNFQDAVDSSKFPPFTDRVGL